MVRISGFLYTFIATSNWKWPSYTGFILCTCVMCVDTWIRQTYTMHTHVYIVINETIPLLPTKHVRIALRFLKK